MHSGAHVLFWLSALAVSAGCGGGAGAEADAASGGGGSGGAQIGSGGAKATGGSTGSGGAKATGGATGSGGAKATGGSTGSGGSQATGGATGSGGSQATGGSLGTGGAPPHVVGACGSLGAVDQWENVTPSSLSGAGILETVTDPINAGTVFVGTDKKGIHKSTDCGASWAKVNTGRNGTVLDSGMQWTMAIDFVEPNVLYAGNLYGSDLSLFKSTNSGVDWDSLFPPGSEVANTVEYNFFQEVSMDPTDPKHLVVSFHSNCKGAYAPMCMAESKDSGATWRLFKGPASGWVEDSRPLVIGGASFLYATAMDGLFLTTDSGATWSRVGPGARHQMYRATSGSHYIGTYYGIHRSTDAGHTWNKINGSPGWTDAVIGDGQRLFMAVVNAGDQHPIITSAENDGATWTPLSSATIGDSPDYFAYDVDHHVIYASARNAGLWRAVTR